MNGKEREAVYQIFFDELNTKLYPSTLLHAYGVNGKISGSVGAIGQMSGGVLAVLHGPMGCAYHYRYSARRRHQPFYALLSSDLTEQEIIFGGTDKLRRTVLEAWERYRPQWIFIIPTPVSDILNEDIQSVARELRRSGVRVAAIQSELFSHRDKNYTRNRLQEIARQKITGDNRLEMELKGCGFTEAIYALVEQVMEPQTPIPNSVNIETVGWGSEGRLVLREMAAFLAICGITVNCWIPSGDLEALTAAPAARLNLVKRVRWARRMKEKFGTDYLHLGGSGRYVGLEGIATLYRDIGEKLGLAAEMEPHIVQAVQEARDRTAAARAVLSQSSCVLVCRGLQDAPFTLKLYAKEFGVRIAAVCLVLTPEMRRNLGITPEMEARLMGRIREAVALYAPGVPVAVNPSREQLRTWFSNADAVVGSNDFTLEGMGAPLLPAWCEMTSLSFESYVRNLQRLAGRMEHRRERDSLILNRMPFTAEHFPRLEERDSLAAREMWERMWLRRKENP